MSDIDDGGPAFPFEYHNQTSRHQDSFFNNKPSIPPGGSEQYGGLTLRDYFAAKALQGMCCNGYLPASKSHENREHDFTPQGYANKAYELADAMIKARRKS